MQANPHHLDHEVRDWTGLCHQFWWLIWFEEIEKNRVIQLWIMILSFILPSEFFFMINNYNLSTSNHAIPPYLYKIGILCIGVNGLPAFETILE